MQFQIKISAILVALTLSTACHGGGIGSCLGLDCLFGGCNSGCGCGCEAGCGCEPGCGCGDCGCACEPSCGCGCGCDGRQFAGQTFNCGCDSTFPICPCTGCDGGCGCEASCGCGCGDCCEASCGCEPGCGCEPSCGCGSGCGHSYCPGDCGFGTCCGQVLSVLCRPFSCGGCGGETYWSEWHNDPPRCCDPCDCYGNWVGPSGYRAPYDHPYCESCNGGGYAGGAYSSGGYAGHNPMNQSYATRGNSGQSYAARNNVRPTNPNMVKQNQSYAARTNPSAARVAVKPHPQQNQRPAVKQQATKQQAAKQQTAKQQTAQQQQPAKQANASRSTSAAQGRPNATMPPQESYLARRPSTGAGTTFQR